MNQSKTIVIISAIVAMMAAFSTFSVEAQTKRALLVGVSDYGNPRLDPGKWRNISGANDVELLSPLFKKQGFAVTTLVDKQVTYAKITGALKKVVKDAKKGDIVYLHFSMHGQPFEDLNGDEADGWDEALIPVDAQMRYAKGTYEGQNHLIDDELEKYFNQIRSKIGPTGRCYVVIDACHAGSMSRGDENVRGTKEGFSRTGKPFHVDRTKERKQYFKIPTAPKQSPIKILEACQSYENNRELYDPDTKKHFGPLSFFIAEVMKNEVIGLSEDWIKTVESHMSTSPKFKKRRLQHMVIETSK